MVVRNEGSVYSEEVGSVWSEFLVLEPQPGMFYGHFGPNVREYVKPGNIVNIDVKTMWFGDSITERGGGIAYVIIDGQGNKTYDINGNEQWREITLSRASGDLPSDSTAPNSIKWHNNGVANWMIPQVYDANGVLYTQDDVTLHIVPWVANGFNKTYFDDLRVRINKSNETESYFAAIIQSASDLSDFGTKQSGRGFGALGMHGYQSSLHDDEVSGEGNFVITDARALDPRLGRWFSVDPVFHPWESPYTSMDNNPISKTDRKGREAVENGDNGKSSGDNNEDITPKGNGGENFNPHGGKPKLDGGNKEKWVVSPSITKMFFLDAGQPSIYGYVLFDNRVSQQRNSTDSRTKNINLDEAKSIFNKNTSVHGTVTSIGNERYVATPEGNARLFWNKTMNDGENVLGNYALEYATTLTYDGVASAGLDDATKQQAILDIVQAKAQNKSYRYPALPVGSPTDNFNNMSYFGMFNTALQSAESTAAMWFSAGVITPMGTTDGQAPSINNAKSVYIRIVINEQELTNSNAYDNAVALEAQLKALYPNVELHIDISSTPGITSGFPEPNAPVEMGGVQISVQLQFTDY